MIRRCTVENYKNWYNKRNKSLPFFTFLRILSSDFPQKPMPEFENTLETIQEIPFGDMHLFTYSPREGTSAMRMRNHVPKKLKDDVIKR